MSEERGIFFKGAKYTLMASYTLNIIVCIIYVIVGTFWVSSAHVITDENEVISAEDAKKATKISGYILVTVAVIGIGLSWMGIYAVYKEIYKLNLYLSIIAIIALIWTFISQPNPIAIVIHTILTGCSIYITFRLKQSKDYSMDDNMEAGKTGPNENSAMVMKAN